MPARLFIVLASATAPYLTPLTNKRYSPYLCEKRRTVSMIYHTILAPPSAFEAQLEGVVIKSNLGAQGFSCSSLSVVVRSRTC